MQCRMMLHFFICNIKSTLDKPKVKEYNKDIFQHNITLKH